MLERSEVNEIELKNLCEVYYSLKEDINLYEERKSNMLLGRVKESVYIEHIKKSLKDSISFKNLGFIRDLREEIKEKYGLK